MTRVRLAIPSDFVQLKLLRQRLWPKSGSEDERALATILAGNSSGPMPLVVFVSEAADSTLVGFVEVGLRSHADGCDPVRPVGYLEGWYVSEGYRRGGIGTDLLRAAEDWARGHGCTEMASDTWIDNEVSQRAHEALGFEVVDRCVNYRKSLH